MSMLKTLDNAMAPEPAVSEVLASKGWKSDRDWKGRFYFRPEMQP